MDLANTVLFPVDLKLEAVTLAVSDVDRAKAFYERLGWRLDIDVAHGDFRGVQFTPPNSATSIMFGKGITTEKPGSLRNLILAVDNIDAAHSDLEVFHFAAGPFNNTVANPRVSGRDPENRSYFSFVSFADPDGNSWLIQEITARLPGREWASTAKPLDVATLASLLHETSEAHGDFERTHGPHNWWDWYAPYLSARQSGMSAEESVAAANRHNEGVPVI
jgi:catechol 2,3-dioxygenase-like lactoylglutathione lyase family enzyme